MSVAFDASWGGSGFARGAATNSLTVSAGSTLAVGASLSNGILIIPIVLGNPSGTATVSTVTWDNGGTNQAAQFWTALSKTSSGGNVMRVEFWYVLAPTSGNKSLKVTTSAVVNDLIVTGISYSGVNQTGGATTFPHTATGSNASSSVQTLTVTSATGNAVVTGFSDDTGSSISFNSGSTTTIYTTVATTNANGAVGRAAGASSVTTSLTPNAPWVGISVDIAAAGGAAFLTAPNTPILQAVKRAAYW